MRFSLKSTVTALAMTSVASAQIAAITTFTTDLTTFVATVAADLGNPAALLGVRYLKSQKWNCCDVI
jgi:hypothetical protein